jgi:methionine salvage enolase-phosphatase E1
MLPLNLSKKCKRCGFETTEVEKYFSKYFKSKDGLKGQCRKCNSEVNDIYTNTEHGFMINLYNNLFKKVRSQRYRNMSEKEKDKHRKGANYLGYSNAVSVDRLDPNIGYTEENIIFISNEANKLKNAVTKDLCIKILELYKEKGL